MKKLLLLLLIAPMIGFGQKFEASLNLPVSSVINIKGGDFAVYNNEGLFVPQGKIFHLVGIMTNTLTNQTDDHRNYSVFSINDSYTEQKFYRADVGYVFSQNTNISLSDDYWHDSIFSFIEYDLNAQNLAYNSPQKSTPTLYPNPTSSLLALNSDKEYDIEVYDMAGNKVMALTGNTIDMSHLSSATYIVKALDKVENEEVSYKVVKN